MALYTTVEDITGKVEWEGGLFEAAFSYGIHHDDIDSEALPELYQAWKAMDEAFEHHFGHAFDRVCDLLYP